MKTLLKTLNIFALFSIAFFSNQTATAQCEGWMGNPKMEEAETAHTLYRGDIKTEKYDAAFENWQIAYTIAPAADGKRPFHYSDGRKIYMHKLKSETDAAKKKEYGEIIMRLYDEQIACYGDDFKAGNTAMLTGRKAYDMFYYLNTPYSKTYKVLQDAVKAGGDKSEYVILDPYARVVVNLFSNEKIDKDEARSVYDLLLGIADKNIAEGGKFTEQYKAGKENVLAQFRTIEKNIFDCAYFKEKHKAEYESNPTPQAAKALFQKLNGLGCTGEDPFMAKLKTAYAAYAKEENAKRQATFEANNPALLASKAYKSGDYATAVAKYQEAVAAESDPVKQAGYYFSMASIEFRKNKSYSKAREHARKAAQLRPDWGKPYMLIGDMYATTSRSCGDSWNQRLAVLAALSKYQKAKSLQPDLEGISGKVSKYLGYRPDKETAFMRGKKSGDKDRVGCLIGETVTISTK